MQGRLGNLLLTVVENLGTGGWMTICLYILLDVFIEGIKKDHSPISRHDGGNMKTVGKEEKFFHFLSENWQNAGLNLL